MSDDSKSDHDPNRPPKRERIVRPRHSRHTETKVTTTATNTAELRQGLGEAMGALDRGEITASEGKAIAHVADQTLKGVQRPQTPDTLDQPPKRERIVRKRPKPPRKRHRVPKGGFTEDFVRFRMKRPKKTDRRRQIRYSHPLQTGLGLGLVVSSGGACSWYAITYPTKGKALWHPLGRWPQLSCVDAKWEAENYFYNPQQVADAKIAPTLDQLFEGKSAVSEKGWLFDYVEKEKRLRSRDEINRVYNTYIKPRFGHEQVYTDGPISRTAINKALNEIVVNNGAAQAQKVLTVLSKLLGWYQINNDSFSSPIVKGMGRYQPVKRKRKLEEPELNGLWRTEGLVSDFCKFAILTGARRAKLLDMRHGDIAEGTWTIRTAEREKGNGEKLPLPALALGIIQGRRTADTEPEDRVFPLAESNINKRVTRLFAEAGIVEHATIHDLKRTCRSLLSRAKVKPWVSRKIVGHRQQSAMDEIYDVDEWAELKAGGLQKLADLIAQICGLNVKPFKQTG
jgi:integrase